VGKTADMCNDLHFCGANNIPAHCTTIEMSKDELIGRLVCIESTCNIDKGAAEGGQFNSHELDKIVKAMTKIAQWDHLLWLSSYRITIDEWVRELRTIMGSADESRRPKIAFLDHLQAVTLTGKEKKSDQVGYVAQVCKEASGEFGIPVVLYSQLKRVEAKWDSVQKKTIEAWPTIGELKESGDIENYADVITLLHRDRESEPNIIHRKVVKQRNGEAYKSFRNTYNGHYYGISED